MIPKEFFVTTGKSVSSVSELNAFDLALKDAGIAQCNLVCVSSVLPANCKEIDLKPLPAGTITYVVMSRMDNDGGETISAGIAWSFEVRNSYGVVAEAHGHSQEEVMELLGSRIQEMAKARGIQIGKICHRIESLTVPPGNYGCVVAVVVYS